MLAGQVMQLSFRSPEYEHLVAEGAKRKENYIMCILLMQAWVVGLKTFPSAQRTNSLYSTSDFFGFT